MHTTYTNLLRVVGTWMTVLVVSPLLFAQIVDDEPARVPVGVQVQYSCGSSQTLTMDFYRDDGTTDTWTHTGSGTVYTAQHSEELQLDRTYILRLRANASISGYTLKMSAPPGYAFFMSDPNVTDLVSRTLVSKSGTMTLNQNISIALRKVTSDAILAYGDSTSWSPDNMEIGFGVGQLANGSSAGRISIADYTHTEADLIYTAPSTEVTVIRSGASLRQVNAPQGLVDIVSTGTNKYELRFYSWKDVTGFNGTEYTISGSATTIATYDVDITLVGFVVTVSAKKTCGAKSWYNKLSYDLVGGGRTIYDWSLNGAGDGTSLRKTIVDYSYSFGYLSTYLYYTISEYGKVSGNWTLARRTRKEYITANWGGPELIALKEGYDPATGGYKLLTSFEYYTSTSDGDGNYRQLKKITRPDGGYTRYTYWDDFGPRGQIKEVFSPFQDVQEGRKVYTTYTNDGTGDRYLVDEVFTYLHDGSAYRLVGHENVDYSMTSANGYSIRVANRYDYPKADTSLLTVVKTYREDVSDQHLRGAPYSIRNPDGTMSSWAYYNTSIVEYYDGAYVWRTYKVLNEIVGKYTGSGLSTFSGQTIDTVSVYDKKSTLTEQWHDVSGLLITDYARVYESSTGQFAYMAGTARSYDKGVWLKQRSRLSYAGGLQIANQIVYDVTYTDGQKVSETDESGADRAFVYDVQGRLSMVSDLGSSAYASYPEIDLVYDEYSYDGANQVTKLDHADNGGTEHIISQFVFDDAGRLQTKTMDCCQTVNFTYPSADKVRETNPDGGWTETDYYRDGTVASTTGTATAPPEYRASYVVADGVSYNLQVTSAWNSALTEGWKTLQYDMMGRVTHVYEPGWTENRVTWNGYSDTTGQLLEQRVYSTTTWAEQVGRRLFTYDDFGRVAREGQDLSGNNLLDDNSVDRLVRHDWTYEKDGTGRWSLVNRTYAFPTPTSGEKLVSEVKDKISLDTNTLAQRSTLDNLNNSSTTTTTVDLTNAVVTETSTFSPAPTASAQRVFRNGLLVREQSPGATGSEQVVVTYDYDNLRRRYEVKGRDSVIRHFFYVSGSLRLWKVADKIPGSSDLVIIEKTYDGSTGRLSKETRKNALAQYGPVDEESNFQYNTQGKVTYVYGNGTNPLKNFYDSYGRLYEQQQYQDDAGTNITKKTWTFDGPNKTLPSKIRTYNASSAYDEVAYAYNVLSQLAQRTWARGTTTTYGYSLGGITKHGGLESVTYNDGTPSVTYAYDRMGRLSNVKDAVDGTTGRSFVSDSSFNDLLIGYEDLPSSFYGSNDLKYLYETSGGTNVPGRSKGVAIGQYSGGSFTETGRMEIGFSSSTGRIGSVAATYGGSKTFTYGYRSNSERLASVSSGSYVRSYDYESWRENRAYVETKWSGTSRAKFDWPAFTWYGQIESYTIASGNNTLAHQYTGSATTAENVTIRYDLRGQVLSFDHSHTGGTDLTRGYDAAGNSTAVNGTSYTVGWKNQLLSSTTLKYDVDGNMTEDAANKYTYDGENRVTAVEQKSGSTRKRLEFKYDYLGRRVEKAVKNWNGSSFVDESKVRFLYDGWNVIAELDASGNIRRTFVWGLDRNSSPTATGGVEALLLIRDHTGGSTVDYYPVYDHHSNVVGLLDGSGNWAAWYRYDAFGRVLSSGGSYATSNPFGFSTKWTDRENGINLVYYGLRYYHPGFGRFLNPDPSGEAGGHNLYRIVGNDPVNRLDRLGLGDTDQPKKDDDEVVKLPTFEVTTRRDGPSINWNVAPPVFLSWSTIISYENYEVDDNPTVEITEIDKTDSKKNELPPCSEFLKKGVTLTGQAFIMDYEIPNIPGRARFRDDTLAGDARGFLSSPADGVHDTYRLSNEVSVSPSGERNQVGRPGWSIEYDPTGLPLRRAKASGPQVGFGYIDENGYQIGLRSAVGEPFEEPVSDLVFPIFMEAHMYFDPAGGTVSGMVETSGYPSFQFFLNGTSILNLQQGESPWAVTRRRMNQVHTQVCDPTK